MQKAFVPLWLIFPCVLACGDDEAPSDGGGLLPGDSGISFLDAGDSSVDASPSDSGGDAPDGTVSSEAGTDANEDGTSEPLTDRGFPVADHCSPFDYSFGPGDCENTQENYDAAIASGIDPDDSVGVGVNIDWQVLPAPMVPGTPYAISHEIELFDENSNWDLEVYGVWSRCAIDGEQAVLLASTPMNQGSGVYCVTAMPTEAYTHIMLVHRQHTEGRGYSSFGQAFCPGGSCPAP